MERALNMLFPEGVPQPNGVPQRPPFPYGRRWRNQRKRWNNYERQFLTKLNEQPEVPGERIKLVPGQMRKSQWMRLNDPSFLKNQEKALNLLFPDGLPTRMQPPPPRPSDGRFLWLRSRRGEIATRSCKYRFPVRVRMTRMDFWNG
jgi:hypothetical protein